VPDENVVKVESSNHHALRARALAFNHFRLLEN